MTSAPSIPSSEKRTSQPSCSMPRGISVGGPQTVTSQPILVKARTFDRATRECRTSPTIQTLVPSSEPTRRRSVYRSSSAWVGCSCLPSPALTTEAGVQRATMLAAPACGERMTIALGSYALSVCKVSLSDSPFSTDEPDDLTLITSADSRLAASSNDELVRVD